MGKAKNGKGGKVKRYNSLDRINALKLLNKNKNDFQKTARETGVKIETIYKWRQRADPLKFTVPKTGADDEEGKGQGKHQKQGVVKAMFSMPGSYKNLVNLSEEQKEALISLYEPNIQSFKTIGRYDFLKLHEFLLAKTLQIALYTTDLDKLSKCLEMTHRVLKDYEIEKEDDVSGFDEGAHKRGILAIFKQYNVHYNFEEDGNKGKKRLNEKSEDQH